WDDYMLGLQKILNPNFVQKIKTQEPDEMPITFAIEKILFLFYLKYQNVLSDELFAQEMREVLNIDDEIRNVKIVITTSTSGRI
ncbi:unnamed protein product, partial [marine sediment metagenome]